ncbi:hypothetical protein TNCT_462491 [Trichonephila clavata]|uniref:Uncharacterized protein n=1 Tax=Trichonephila clavata TaxID=2740835 RepID=A0A8X6I4T6_TRICU|nr:hypothetical protein TNCT_462491 [Trichonephila clavata]
MTSPPTQTWPGTSADKALPTPAPSTSTPKSSIEIFNTLNQLKNLEVMFEVLSQFDKISKSKKTGAEKFSELSRLLNLVIRTFELHCVAN